MDHEVVVSVFVMLERTVPVPVLAGDLPCLCGKGP